ncbi:DETOXIFICATION 42 [Olea europaea subsp. europaea]|nr:DETOXIFICATION 42 [Olea europaea subsp. europaea]
MRSLKGETEEIKLLEKGFSADSELIPKTETSDGENKKRHISSASSAMAIGAILGLIQSIFVIFAAKPILEYMGIKSNSPMLKPALRYLTLRSLLFKTTKTAMVGDAANIVLDPIFIFLFGMGVSGAAIAHVISQYLIALMLMWRLSEQVSLLPPTVKDLQLGRFFKNGLLLLFRVIAATSCITLAASLAAKLGSTSMAAFQVCLQVWLATSLLADGLAVAGQAILANAFARKDYERATATAVRVLQWSLVLGLVLSLVVAVILKFSSEFFTKDITVLRLLHLGIPFVAVTQPINSLAFVFDGINFGASDFAYSAYSMVLIAASSIFFLFFLSSSHGFVGIWIALSIFMSLRALAGFLRIGTRTGPWGFLRS